MTTSGAARSMALVQRLGFALLGFGAAGVAHDGPEPREVLLALVAVNQDPGERRGQGQAGDQRPHAGPKATRCLEVSVAAATARDTSSGGGGGGVVAATLL